MENAQTNEELEKQQESKAQASVPQGTVLIMMDPIVLGCVFVKLPTIKAVNSTSRFFASKEDADFLQKKIAFLRD